MQRLAFLHSVVRSVPHRSEPILETDRASGGRATSGRPAIGKAASSGSCSMRLDEKSRQRLPALPACLPRSRRQFGTHRIQKQAFLNGGLDQGGRGNRKQGRFHCDCPTCKLDNRLRSSRRHINRHQANRCYDSKADFLRLQKLSWCPRRDSNSHDRSRGILSPLRLPIPPLGPGQPSIVLAVRCQFCRRSGHPQAERCCERSVSLSLRAAGKDSSRRAIRSKPETLGGEHGDKGRNRHQQFNGAPCGNHGSGRPSAKSAPKKHTQP